MAKDNIRLNDLRRAFRESAIIGAIMLIANIVETNVMTMRDYYNRTGEIKEYYENLQFTFSSSDGSSGLMLTLFVTFFSMILAWKMFGFVNNKKKVNIFFSFGISRKDMFANRFIVASVMIVTSIVVPFILGTIWNISVFGSSTALVQSAIFLVFRLLLFSFFSFALTVLVTSLVGTKGEQFVLAPIFLFAITAVSFFVDSLKKLLFYGGIELGGNISPRLYLNNYTYVSNQNADQVLKSIGRFNNFPLIGNHEAIGKYVSIEKGAEKNPLDFVALAGLVLMVVVLSFFAYRAFVNRKAENAGFLGASPFANIVFTGIAGVGIVAVVASQINIQVRNGKIERLNSILSVAIIAGIFLLAYMILMPILTRNKKAFVKSLWKLPVFILVLIIPAVIFATGGFGASKRVPKVSEIKAATVSVPIDITLTGKAFGGNMHSGYINFEGTSNSCFVGFTSENDLEQIRRIHQGVLDVKDESNSRKRPYMDNLVIVYELKDGTILSRKYDYFNRSVADKLLKIVDSDFLKKEYIDAFANTVPMSSEEYEKYSQNFPPDSYHFENSSAVNSALNGKIVEVMNAQSKVTDISMDENQITGLRKAVAKDLETVPLSRIYLAQKHSMGTIRFKEPEESTNHYEFGLKIPVVEEMKNTLAYLENFAFSKKQDDAEKPISALVYDINVLKGSNSESRYIFTEYYLFSERNVAGDLHEDAFYKEKLKNSVVEFNSQDSIEKLRELSLTNQYTYNEGYAVVYRFADKTQRAEYVPYDKMPNELKPA